MKRISFTFSIAFFSIAFVLFISCENPIDTDASKKIEKTGGTNTNLKVTAPIRHTVTFDSNGGSVVASERVADGGKVRKPRDPTRAGYRLDGWYEEAGHINKVNFTTTTITADLTLYAKWEVEVYTVTFDSDGGSEVASERVADGGKVSEPRIPTRAGYRLDGWYEEAGHINKVDFTTKLITGNVTLYAKWIKEYTVTFDSDGGSEVASERVADGGTASEPREPTREGYRLDGWYEEAGYINKVNFTTKLITADLTLYAKWEVKVYTVIFDSDGGSEVVLERVTHGETASEPRDPTRADYRFDGWYEEVAHTNKVNFTTKLITEDVTLYAKWIQLFQGTAVLPGAFMEAGLTELTEDNLPAGATEIQNGAFAGNDLRTLTNLPTSLRTIGDGSFQFNEELTEVTIPEGVIEIGVGAFALCERITTLRLPSTLKRIGKEAFGISGFGMAARAIILPESLEFIGVRAFTRNHFSEITIPKSVTSIGDGAFDGGFTLRTVTLTPELYNQIKVRAGGLRAVFGPLVGTYRDHEGNKLN